MSDIKFSCPKCSQHIACGPEYAGLQIKCPACQADIAIPGVPIAAPPPPPKAAPLRVNVGHTAAPPPPQNIPLPPPPPPRASGLAVARPTAPAEAHGADGDNALPLATAGAGENRVVQWAGLSGAFLVAALIVAMAATWKPPEKSGEFRLVREKRGRKYVTVMKPVSAKPVDADAEMEEDDGDDDTTNAPAIVPPPPAVPQWTLDLAAAHIPEGKASGQVHGQPFKADRAYLQRTAAGYVLMVRDGPGPQVDKEITVVIPLRPGEKLDGRSWNISQNASNGSPPRVIKRWLQNARSQAKTFTNGYAMKLEFGPPGNNEFPGKVFVALPDDEKSYLAGTLNASVLVAAPPRRSQ